MSKYKNKKVIYNNIKFDSIKEKNMYATLKLLEKAKKISNLELQKKYVLQDKFIHNGKTIREICYYADFVYNDEKGNLVVLDTKGFKTKEYKLKKKMLLYRYGIEIKEI